MRIALAVARAAFLPILLALLAACARTPPLDAQTGCPPEPPAETILLLAPAASEPASVRLALQALAREEARRLSPEARFSLALLQGQDPETPARLLLSRCAMGEPAAAAELASALNSVFAARAEDAPLVAAIDKLVRRPHFDKAPTRRLVLAADMMERRAGEFSLYAAGADYQSFRRTQAGLRPPADLAGVSVRIVQRLDADRETRQREARTLFWKPYFEAAGAAEVAWEP